MTILAERHAGHVLRTCLPSQKAPDPAAAVRLPAGARDYRGAGGRNFRNAAAGLVELRRSRRPLKGTSPRPKASLHWRAFGDKGRKVTIYAMNR
jgi:hypothetical protein